MIKLTKSEKIVLGAGQVLFYIAAIVAVVFGYPTAKEPMFTYFSLLALVGLGIIIIGYLMRYIRTEKLKGADNKSVKFS